MKLRPASRETFLYVLALILALVVRLYNLGAAPLSDYEAVGALHALHIADPQDHPLAAGPSGPVPASYLALTGPLFFLFGSSNFLARLWPALAGVLLACLPILLRKHIGRSAAIILAFGLALDPGLVTVSRLAGGPMLALACGLLALALWANRQPVLAGILAGLALVSGTAVITGLLILGLVWVVFRLARQPLRFSAAPEDVPEAFAIRPFIASAAASALLTSSLFLFYPQGMAVWISALPEYLKGWSIGTDAQNSVSAGKLILALFTYQPIAVLLTVIGIVAWLVRMSQAEAIRQESESSLSEAETLPAYESPQETTEVEPPVISHPQPFPIIWSVIGLIVVLLYPGRQVFDLVWVLVPLWMLCAWSLESNLPDIGTNPISMAHAGVLLLLCALFWNTLIATRLVAPLPNLPWPVVRLGVLLVVIVLGSLTSALIALGWSWPISRDGLAWGLGAAFTIYMIGAMWGAAHLRTNMPEELWGPGPATIQADLFMQTMTDLSKWQTGLANTMDIVSIVNVPSLRWALRDFPNTLFLSAPPPGKTPAIMITAQQQTPPELAASYRGQDFQWQAWPGWSESLPPDFVSWLTFRKAPLQTAQIILWARADLNPVDLLPKFPDTQPVDLQEP